MKYFNTLTYVPSDSLGGWGGGEVTISYLNISCELGYLGTVGG